MIKELNSMTKLKILYLMRRK